jgi:phosphoglycolate phosphatase-like HAD superfamily hydrolase
MCLQVFPDLSEAELQRMTQAYRAHYDTVGLLKTTLFDGGEALVARCVELGIEVDIATNKPMRAAGAILSRLNLGQYLRSVTAVDAITPSFAGKEELLRYVCRINHVDGATSWYVGDTEEDRLAAEACGLGFVFAAYGYGESAHARRIGSLSELIPLLEKT